MNITGITESGALVFGMPGYEVNLLYSAALLALAIGGAGAYSVDERRGGVRIGEPATA
jgi:putative oxidoreductase